MIKYLFLDIDGVLNGYSRFTGICYKIFSKLHLLKFVKKHYDLFGVRTNKVKILSKIVKKTGAKVVISSSWRGGWFKPYFEKEGMIHTNDEELNSFLFSLGCYSGEPITVVSRKKRSCVVSIKDGRYNIDNQLAEAILI